MIFKVIESTDKFIVLKRTLFRRDLSSSLTFEESSKGTKADQLELSQRIFRKDPSWEIQRAALIVHLTSERAILKASVMYQSALDAFDILFRIRCTN